MSDEAPPDSQADELTDLQKRFVEEYLVDLNASAAARRAGYSEASAGSIGHENLKKPEIQRHISDAIARRSARTNIDQDRVLQRLAAITFSSIKDVASWDKEGNLRVKASSEITEEQALAILEVHGFTSENGRGEKTSVLRVRREPSLKAVELLMRHLDMFKKDSDPANERGPSISVTDQQLQALVDAARAKKAEDK